MFKLALRGLAAHKSRLAATTVAVMLGVSFISGTYVLTDTLKAAITSAIGKSQANVAVLVQAPAQLAPSGVGAFAGSNLTVPASTVAAVAVVPGVAAADGVVYGEGKLTRPDGGAVGTNKGLSVILSVGSVASLNPLVLVSGRFPNQSDQATVDVGTASRDDLSVGSRLKLAAGGAAQLVQVVGIADYGTAKSLGAAIVGLTQPAAQAVLGDQGRVSEVAASAVAGVSSSTLKARVSRALGRNFTVQTQKEAQASLTQSINKGFSVFSDILLVFAGVALFVALFLIFNTFSILLAQRARELALLRCLGAFRRQVATSVLIEALGVGIIASLLGLGLGVLLALGLRALLSGVGASFPSVTPVIETRTVVVSLLVGTVATMVAAVLPAIRGSRTPPVTASAG